MVAVYFAERAKICLSASVPRRGAEVAAEAIAWKWPNDSANCIASARSAIRETLLIFDRIHVMRATRPTSKGRHDESPYGRDALPDQNACNSHGTAKFELLSSS